MQFAITCSNDALLRIDSYVSLYIESIVTCFRQLILSSSVKIKRGSRSSKRACNSWASRSASWAIDTTGPVHSGEATAPPLIVLRKRWMR